VGAMRWLVNPADATVLRVFSFHVFNVSIFAARLTKCNAQ
jgi:hypothetical protein